VEIPSSRIAGGVVILSSRIAGDVVIPSGRITGDWRYLLVGLLVMW
jgi:hypothetical protein